MSDARTRKDQIVDLDSCQSRAGIRPSGGWLASHCSVLKAGSKASYMDPFLSPVPSRHVPPLLVIASPAARFIVPDRLLLALAEDLSSPAPTTCWLRRQPELYAQRHQDTCLSRGEPFHSKLKPTPPSAYSYGRCGVCS